MENITQKVTLHHLKKNLMLNKEEIYRKSILELFYKFLKKEKLFSRIYTRHKYFDMPTINDRNAQVYLPDVCLVWSKPLVDSAEENYLLSQLWRFFVLQNVDKLAFPSDNTKKAELRHLCQCIEANGRRGSNRLFVYFDEYDELIKKCLYN